ncbi:MAG: NAD(P)-dependent oxidoreductase [Candidatus Tantalella remota]|nr:NAD(P)-dependent oxidoreductase [Candidatus Tantalella remota]
MKILVTGATGFIGAAVADRLKGDGHDVVCLVRKTSKTVDLEKKGFYLVEGDIVFPQTLAKVFGEVRPEAVFHCAARVWDDDEEGLLRDNGEGTQNVCEACYGYGVKRLVYLSSVAVVSGNEDVPLTDDLEYKASDAYGRSKIEAERAAILYREKGLNVSIIRPCIVYGEDEPHAFDGILNAIAKKRVPVLDVSGMDSKLNLVYLGNVVQAAMLAFEKEEALEGTFMVADREVITLRKFVEILADEIYSGRPMVIPGWLVRAAMIIPLLRRKAKRYFKDRVYDISRAEDILGYDPEVSTEEGFRRTVRYWKRKRSRE